MKENLKKYMYAVVVLLPFVLGTVGFLMDGAKTLDAMFFTVGLFFLENSDPAPNLYVEAARWLAPVVLVSSVIMTIKSLFSGIRNAYMVRFHDALVLYCPEEKKDDYLRAFRGSVYNGSHILKHAKKHIVLMETDAETIAFAEQIQEGTVYAELKEVDSFLMKATKVRYFNTNEIIARLLWKEQDLLQENVENYRIGIVGDSTLTATVLKFGLMNNIYSLTQHIEYHVYSSAETALCDVELYNDDRVIRHDKVDESFYQNDRVIFCDGPQIDRIEELLYRSRNVQIYYVGTEDTLSTIYDGTQVHCFGTTVYDTDLICTDRLYRNAMELNYHYECLYGGADPADPEKEQKMQQMFEQMSGFLKGSNIAATDYNDIRRKMLVRDGDPEIVSGDKYVQMEHLRWCRYHTVNHWVYGTPANKAERNRLRIHNCLIPFDALDQENKEKDLETIQTLLSL